MGTKSFSTLTLPYETHGTVLNMYFAKILNAFDELPDRWSGTPFCAMGVIEDGEIIQDITIPLE